MRFIDKAKTEKVTEDDLENIIEQWKTNSEGETIEAYLGISNNLRCDYEIGNISFEDMLAQAIAQDNLKNLDKSASIRPNIKTSK